MNKVKPLVIQLQGQAKYQRLLAGAPQTMGMRSGFVALQPGEEIGLHSTDSKEEVLMILRGTAQVTCAKESPFIVAADSIVYIPPFVEHNVTNAGSETLHYVYIVSPVHEEISTVKKTKAPHRTSPVTKARRQARR